MLALLTVTLDTSVKPEQYHAYIVELEAIMRRHPGYGMAMLDQVLSSSRDGKHLLVAITRPAEEDPQLLHTIRYF